jgi:hypothetical protein
MVQERGAPENKMAKHEHHYFECKCNSDEHTFKFEYFSSDGELYLSVFLNDWEPWYKRVWKAVKYVFGYKCKYGHWDTTVLDTDTTTRLKVLLERSLVDRKQQNIQDC